MDEELVDIPVAFKGRKEAKSIMEDLEIIPIAEDIKAHANTIYQRMTVGTKRKANRSMLVFMCVFYAYEELDIVFDPSSLGKLFGLNRQGIHKAAAKFSPVNTGYSPPPRFRSPLDFIPEHCHKAGLDNTHVDAVVAMAQCVKACCSDIDNAMPQVASAAIVTLYMRNLGYDVSKLLLVDCSDALISALRRKISASYNVDARRS